MTSAIGTQSVRERGKNFMMNPWAQAIMTGAVTLAPMRNYPGWLRQSMLWGPLLGGVIAGGYIGANPDRQRELNEFFAKFNANGSAEPQPAEQTSPSESSERSWTPLRAAAAGGTFGAVMSGATALGFWADEKIERGLRRMKVPMPRLVMAVAVGGMNWWQGQHEAKNRSAAPRRSDHI